MAQEIARGRPGVVFGAFTGKAASVMRAKGCDDATTIHGMIYRRIADDLTNRPVFVLNEEGAAARATLIIIDECSMVDEKLGRDLLSFRRPILVLGDPMQLPPVQGAGFFTKDVPDVLLTEVHRQAAGNPIIEFATRTRQGQNLHIGTYGGSQILSARDLDLDTVMKADQILVGQNNTRTKFNTRMRELLGRRGPMPVAGDKLVCLRNNHQRGLLNGSLWFVEAVLESEAPEMVRLSLRSESGDVTAR
jgi:exodeoxyribonuclease-5